LHGLHAPHFAAQGLQAPHLAAPGLHALQAEQALAAQGLQPAQQAAAAGWATLMAAKRAIGSTVPANSRLRVDFNIRSNFPVT